MDFLVVFFFILVRRFTNTHTPMQTHIHIHTHPIQLLFSIVCLHTIGDIYVETVNAVSDSIMAS